MEPKFATKDPYLNLKTVGAPGIVIPEEARDTLVVPLPASVQGVQTQTLTYRIPPETDFYVDSISLILWEVVEDAPNPTELRWVEPVRCGPAPVYLAMYDAAARRNLQERQIHWANIAGVGRTPHYLGIPHFIAGGHTLNITIQNRSTDRNFAVNLQLHGRYKLAERDRQGQPIAPTVSDAYAALADAHSGPGIELVGSDRLNYLGAGVSHQAVIPQDLGEDGTLGNSNYNAPGTFTRRQFFLKQDPDYVMMVRYIMAGVNRDATTACEEAGRIADADLPLRWPIFCRIQDLRNRWWLTNDYVPLAALAGWAGQPYILPVDWSWGSSGTSLLVEVASYAVWPDIDEPIALNMNFQGWLTSKEASRATAPRQR